MSIWEVWTFLFVYLLPIVFFVYTGADVMLRNRKKTEHQLVFLTASVYILMFVEEYIRHQLPISYSPELSALWFSNVGIIMPGLGFHFLVKFSGMDKKMPRYLYPGIFYLPLLVIPINIMSSKEVISTSEFIQDGLWKYPVYNKEYYIALTVSIVLSSLYLVVLFKGKKTTKTPEHKAIYHLLIFGVIVCSGWHIVFGFVQFDNLPPYPYIYGGVIWCFILRLAMSRYDFLDYASKRYEKLFNLNPAAILLVDHTGRIREANPSARQLFDYIELKRIPYFKLVNNEIQEMIQSNKEIKNFETTIYNGMKRLDVLIDGDSITIDNETLIILIVRDITIEKENQEEILFLAYHDPLTRLPNRRYFYEKLNEAVKGAQDYGLQLSVIMIDLDFLKETNDRYGHEAGDEVLRLTGRILNEITDVNTVAARLGGDEFALYMTNTPSTISVDKIIGQLKKRFVEEKLVYQDYAIPVMMSIGVSHFPEDGTDGKTLLRAADKKMYQDKRSNKYNYEL